MSKKAKKRQRASILAPNVRGTLESEKERRGENRRKVVREPDERGGTQTRPSYLRVPIYRESNPSFPVRRGPRRFRRLNAINDLIPVITVLIYCARAREGSDFLDCESRVYLR